MGKLYNKELEQVQALRNLQKVFEIKWNLVKFEMCTAADWTTKLLRSLRSTPPHALLCISYNYNEKRE